MSLKHKKVKSIRIMVLISIGIRFVEMKAEARLNN